MVPLATIREDLGLSAEDTSLNSMLERSIAQATRLVRQRTGRWIHGAAIASGGVSSLTVYSAEHGLRPGDKLRLLDDANAVSGSFTVATITRHTLTTTTGVAGTVTNVACSLHPLRAATLHGNGRQDLVLTGSLAPMLEITKLQVDGQDVAFTLPPVDSERIVKVRKTDGTLWGREFTRVGMSTAFSTVRPSAEKSVYVEAYVGARYCPSDIEMVVMSLVAEMAELEGSPKDIQTSSSEGVQRTRLSGAERMTQTISPDRVLADWRA